MPLLALPLALATGLGVRLTPSEGRAISVGDSGIDDDVDCDGDDDDDADVGEASGENDGEPGSGEIGRWEGDVIRAADGDAAGE